MEVLLQAVYVNIIFDYSYTVTTMNMTREELLKLIEFLQNLDL
jgi:hypothetical protein